MKFHPLADIFPLMEGAAFESLVEDIKTNGLIQPITRYKGDILDGRNRFRACTEAKVKPRFEDYGGHDPLAHVISLNVHRRQLNEGQRAMAAKRAETTTHGGNRKGDQDQNSDLDRKSLAELFKISHDLVWRAGIVQSKGVPALIKAVDSGDIAVNRAASIAKKPAEEQKKQVAKLLSKEREQREAPRGNALIRVWDTAKPEAQILFLEERGDDVAQLLRGLRA